MINRSKARSKNWGTGIETYEDAVLRSPDFLRHIEALGEEGVGFLEYALDEGFEDLVVCSGAYNGKRDGKLVIHNTEHAYIMSHPDGRVRVISSQERLQDLARRDLETPKEGLVREEYDNKARFALEASHLATKRTLRTRLSRALDIYNSQFGE